MHQHRQRRGQRARELDVKAGAEHRAAGVADLRDLVVRRAVDDIGRPQHLQRPRARAVRAGVGHVEGSQLHLGDVDVEPSRVDADEARDIQELIEAVREQDAGSLPDDRSRRNVRNRFPQRGLPEEAFWRNDDYEPREGRDRDAEISEHDRRFGRYYDDDGNLNDRGRLVNEQLREEREEDDAPLSPRER